MPISRAEAAMLTQTVVAGTNAGEGEALYFCGYPNFMFEFLKVVVYETQFIIGHREAVCGPELSPISS